MYHRYFGLREEPFSIAVNPRYLFMSDRHRDALAHLLYGVGTGGGFILLTGEVGTGKTTINRCLLEQLPAETDIAIILNPALDARELLASACDELGIEYPSGDASLKELTDRLHAFLLANHGRGRNTVLLIDEAQHLKFEVLEQIRLLTNLETDTRKLLQIILVGQPELAEMLRRPELRQLNQRITARYNLQALNLAETRAYIRHRLQVAGLPANQELFPPAVVKEVYRRTGGIPRLINLLCDRALLGAYGQDRPRVDKAVLRQAAVEALGEPAGRPGRRAWVPAIAALVATVAVAFVLRFAPSQTESGFEQPAAPAVEEAARAAPVTDVAPRVPWYLEGKPALRALARHLGMPGAAGIDGCENPAGSEWQCETLEAETWDELLRLDHPVVLSLLTPERFQAHAVLVGLSRETASLLYEGERRVMPLRELGPLWRGDYHLLWRPPADYTGPVSLGDRGPLVAWLAREFAALDGQAVPLAENEFNAALDTRVRIFQREQALLDDGVVGLKTLLRLNAERGDSSRSLRNVKAVASGSAR